MTDTIDAVTADEVVDQQQLAEQLVAQARSQGIDLVGPGGLLNQITKRVLEAVLEAEMSEHLGYDKHEYFGGMVEIPVTGCAPRPCSPRSGRCRSRFLGTPKPRSLRRSCGNDSDA